MAGENELKDETIDDTCRSRKINLSRLRSRIRNYIDKHHYDSAVFWADKLVTLSNGLVDDLYWLAQCLYLTGQYHRALHLLRNKKLEKNHIACRYLVALCHFQCKEWQEALDILDMLECNQSTPSAIRHSMLSSSNEPSSGLPTIEMESSVNLLRGKIYEAMDNRTLAVECFREALRQDVYCFEAFDLLVNHHMLTAQEEYELLESLPFTTQCPDEEADTVRFLYTNRLKKYAKPGEINLPTGLERLQGNLDLEVNIAEQHYYNCDFMECYKLTTRILKQDVYNSQCLPLRVVTLVELKKSNELFYLAHKLVDLYPNKPISWFAVGCYYYLIGNYDPARRYLSKATTLDRAYGPAWLAFGHSFAVDNEHDQAMAAYFTASQLMKGCHLPVLYVGLEYGLTNNSTLAERFFNLALSIAPEDPFVLHEMGVISFQNGDYETAEKQYLEALEKVKLVGNQVVMEKWEPLLNNLGHVYRKLKKYDHALEFHKNALVLSPQNASTLSSIGYIYVLMGDHSHAADYFHKALGIRRDDAFSTTMLGHVMEALMMEGEPCSDVPEELPFSCSVKLEEAQADLHTSNTDLEASALELSSIAENQSIEIEVEMELETSDG